MATEDRDPISDTTTVKVGVIADTGAAEKMVQDLPQKLPKMLANRVDRQIDWQVDLRGEEIVLDPDDKIRLNEKARTMMPAEGWDILVFLTDLPRHDRARPLVAEIDPEVRAAVVSLPALGAFGLRGRVRRLVAHVVGAVHDVILESTPGQPAPIDGHLLDGPAGRAAPTRRIRPTIPEGDTQLVLTGVRGRARLMFGMVRDNKPWRLIPSLSRAIAASSAAAAFGIFYPTIWRMADHLSTIRLAMISVFAVCAMVIWLIVHNDLWERSRGVYERQATLLNNLASVLTLLVGVVSMYVILFLFALAAAMAVISEEYLQIMLRHPGSLADYVRLAWFSSSLGTIAGALGSSLETEGAIERAAYSRRERQRRARRRQEERQEEQSSEVASSS